MESQKFIIEVKNPLKKDDFIRLRFLYLPIIGNDSAMLYSLLNDLYLLDKDKKMFLSWKEIKNILKISYEDLEIAKNKLEAIGLLTTFEKSDNVTFIYSLNKPSTAQNIRKNNVILYKEIIKNVGERTFEKIYFYHRKNLLDKSEYKNITLKYQEVFKMHKQEESKNTLLIPLYQIDSVEQAIKELNSLQFIYFLTSEKASPSQISLINRIQLQNISYHSLNLIINYSFEKNGFIVNNHVEKIANDLISKSIYSPQAIEKELLNARNNLKKTKFGGDNKKNLKKDQTEDDNSLSSKDWRDIFKKLGGDL